MSDETRVFIYSGSEVPKPLRPPKEGELHVWLDQGRKWVLTNGTWVEWADAEADGPSLQN